MTITLRFPGNFNQALLMDELLDAFPEWLTGNGEDRRCLLGVHGWPGDYVELALHDPAASLHVLATVRAIVAAHDPTAESRVQALAARVASPARAVVGVELEALSLPQVRALLGLVLLRAGALDPAGRIRPPEDWS